jgi:hypothetical protein
MRHLDDGTLRRIVDEPLAVSSEAQSHYEGCDACQARGREISDAARSVAQALGDSGAPSDAGSAYARFANRVGAGAPSVGAFERVAEFYRWSGRRSVVPIAATLAAAAVVLALIFTPAGTFAQNFLTIFEPRQFVAINVSKGELQYLPDLQSFGTVTQHGEPEHRNVATPAQAAALSGLPVRLPSWVPASVPRPVHFTVMSRGTASFIFSAAKARAFAASARQPMPAMPPGLDGSVLTLQVGPMVVVSYGALPQQIRRTSKGHDEGPDAGDLPPLVIVESVAPRVSSTGATTREIETYLLAMPGVAPQLADEIRAIGDPSTTMPIPIPIDKAYSQNVSIDGTSGLAIGDDTGVGGAIVWQKHGIVYCVGGTMPQRQLMEIAQSLR